MINTCEKRYSTSWLTVIQKSFGSSKYDFDPRGLCTQKASQFREGVQISGDDYFTGNATWCENPCVAQYLIGNTNYLHDCGNIMW